MRRLLDMLTAPLAQWSALGASDRYAGWVGVRARIELLQAHAQCVVIATSDSTTASVVGKAHTPYR